MIKKTFHFPKNFKIRNSTPSDHPRIIGVLKDWWSGRDLTSSLPMLFFKHFCTTSFIIVDDNEEIIAFLVGFLSQAQVDEGYIHFIGVHPKYREVGFGRYLYEKFYQICKENDRSIVRACTSPENKGSIEFHKKLGFRIESGNGTISNIPVTLDYNRPGDPKVLFVKNI